MVKPTPWLIAMVIAWAGAGGAQAQRATASNLLATPIAVERREDVASVPIALRGGKLFIEAAVDGSAHEFIFDTGSPTMISRDLSESLGLEIVGRNIGVDAHGAEVAMDIAIIDRLSIGAVVFRHVPVLVFDFSTLDLGDCLLDGGVIGSEIFPGSVWRIDLGERRLTIAESAAALGATTATLDAPLHDFGYPHAPIVEYALGEMVDRALFDTGNAEQVALYAPLLDDAGGAEAIVSGSLRSGRGSEGESAGGAGVVGDLFRLDLSGLTIDGQPLGRVNAASRAVPPTLLGAGLLRRHIVTLDYPGRRFLLDERNDPAPPRTHPGFGISYRGNHAQVVQLFDDSAAAAAGLRLGDEVIALDRRSMAVGPGNDRCSAVRWLVEDFDPSRLTEIEVLRDGEHRTISLSTQEPRAQ